MPTISSKSRRHVTLAIAATGVAALALGPALVVPEAVAQDALSPTAEKHQPIPDPDRIATTLTDDPATSRAVSWRTDDSIETGEAQIAEATGWTDFEDGARTVTATTAPLEADLGFTNHYHQVEFDGLEPDTTYVYRVGDDETDVWSEWIEFGTATQGAEPFQFIFLGDAQNGLEEHWTRLVQRAYKDGSDADLLVHPGDLINLGHRDQEWGEWMGAASPQAASIPNLVVPGNHEYFGPGGFRADRQLSQYWDLQFALPDNGPEGHEDFEGTVYSTDYQGVRFIGLNSAYREAEQDDPAGQAAFIDAQAQWLEEQLQDNPNRWTVVFFHHPIYSTAREKGEGQPELRERWRPLLEEHGVDLVLSGHDHSYGRGFTADERYGDNPDRLDGPVYVNSVSGPKMYEPSGTNWVENGAELQELGGNVQLYQLIDVEDRTLRIVSRTATGEFFDGFEVVEWGSGFKRVVELDADDVEDMS